MERPDVDFSRQPAAQISSERSAEKDSDGVGGIIDCDTLRPLCRGDGIEDEVSHRERKSGPDDPPERLDRQDKIEIRCREPKKRDDRKNESRDREDPFVPELISEPAPDVKGEELRQDRDRGGTHELKVAEMEIPEKKRRDKRSGNLN